MCWELYNLLRQFYTEYKSAHFSQYELILCPIQLLIWENIGKTHVFISEVHCLRITHYD